MSSHRLASKSKTVRARHCPLGSGNSGPSQEAAWPLHLPYLRKCESCGQTSCAWQAPLEDRDIRTTTFGNDFSLIRSHQMCAASHHAAIAHQPSQALTCEQAHRERAQLCDCAYRHCDLTTTSAGPALHLWPKDASHWRSRPVVLQDLTWGNNLQDDLRTSATLTKRPSS